MTQALKKPTAQRAPITGTATMTVICKIPQGILLQLHVQEKKTEVTQSGTREIVASRPIGDPFMINGPAHAQGEGVRHRTAHGFALTEDVPKELWEQWYEQTGRHLAACHNGLLMAFDNAGFAIDAAREAKRERTGLERLNPAALPNLGDQRFKIKTADEQVAAIEYPVEE